MTRGVLDDIAPASPRPTSPVTPSLERFGADLVVVWPGGVSFRLAAIRDGREGVRGELTVMQGARRLTWGAFALSSIQTRDSLRRKLVGAAPDLPWGEYLDETAYRLTHAVREGEPLVTLTGTVASPTRELLPRLLYEGDPTLLYADGDTGKSLAALAIAVAIQSETPLPYGLTPARAVPAAYLDWETSRDTVELRLALLAGGLGIEPPGILYKRMARPLVDEATSLAAEFARRGIGLVVIDSMMFALAGGDGAGPHEPITAFYNALRLFAPAASLVLSHVTNADAKGGTPARPYGGAFAFNGPRLAWELKRDRDVEDAAAIVFTCKKANNFARRPDPFGLRFVPGAEAITVYPFHPGEAAAQTVAGASLSYRVRLALSSNGPQTVDWLADALDSTPDIIRRTLNRCREKGTVVVVPNTAPQQWAPPGSHP